MEQKDLVLLNRILTEAVIKAYEIPQYQRICEIISKTFVDKTEEDN